MKCEQTTINLSELQPKKSYQMQHFQCIKNNSAILLCQNKNCSNNTFLCSSQTCQCRQTHKKCLKTSIQEFFTQINKKIYPTSNIKQKVDSIIDQAIDYISKIRDQIYLDLKYLGLRQQEKQLMELIQKKQFNLINGTKIWRICQNIYQEKQISSTYIIKELNKYWEGYQKKFKKNIQKLKDISQKQCDLRAKLFKDSEILMTNTQIDTLCGFFNTQIVSTSLLYSAKQSNYSMKKYRQCAGHKHTLLIVKSQAGKIFGGFLDIQIPKFASHNTFGGGGMNVDEYKPQKSHKAFVYSLTNNDKFDINLPSQAFIVNPSEGPIFGRNFLGIYRRFVKPTPINPPPNNGFQFGAFGATNIINNNINNDDNQNDDQIQNPLNTLGNHQNQNNFGGFGGFGTNAGLYGAGFGQMPQINNQIADKKLTEHHCIIFNGKAYINQKYKNDEQSRIKFAGTAQKSFAIKQWQLFELHFEQQ